MENKICFKELSAFIECSTGSTPKVETLKKYINILSEFGYTHLYLGLTDAYKIEGEPYFNFCRGGYTTEQLQILDAYAQERGIELRANIQILGHLSYMQKHGCYRELFDTSHILMVGEEKVYEFIDKIFQTMSIGIQSRTIHIGMDEAIGLGTGQYLKKHGATDTQKLFFEHLRRVLEIAKKYGYFCELWSDMFYRMVQGSDFDDDGIMPENLKECIPEGVRIVHWNYNRQTDEVLCKQIRQNRAICEDMTFAGCAWKIIGLAPDNKYSMEVMEQQIQTCIEEGVQNYMVTMWSDNGAHCSIFAVLPSLFAAAEMARGKSLTEIDKESFSKITGVKFDTFILADNLNNPFFKELHELNSRSYWGLMSDIFLGTYDYMLDEHTNEAYACLADIYEQMEYGEFQQIFEDYRLMAKVLSIKMNLGMKVRKAYRTGNKEILMQAASVEIPQMITYMQAYMDHFNHRWLNENMAFGLEVHHLFYGGLVTRWEYVANRLLQYMEDGRPIEEMERPELPASILPPTDENRCLEMNYHNLLSFCGI